MDNRQYLVRHRVIHTLSLWIRKNCLRNFLYPAENNEDAKQAISFSKTCFIVDQIGFLGILNPFRVNNFLENRSIFGMVSKYRYS